MNWGRRKHTRPDISEKQVEFVSCSPSKGEVWNVCLKVSGWPHTVRVRAKDELDVMKQVLEMQRGKIPVDAFDVSK